MDFSLVSMYMFIVIQFFVILPCEETGYQDIIFVILSQGDVVHEQKALTLEADIKLQTNNSSTVYVSHRDLAHVGAWTVVPLFERLWNSHGGTFKWIFFSTERTKFNVTSLISSIQQYNLEPTFIGKALYDLEPTIIHHFSLLPDFKYPLFDSGFGINNGLLKRLMISTDKKVLKKVDFSIDASHELSMFIKKNLNGISLVNNPNFCLIHKEDCATFVDRDDMCNDAVDIKNIFFAVKTCEKFHLNRIPVVKKTWAGECHHIEFFSDTLDESIPTVKLNNRNVNSGHCVKTETIFKIMRQYFIENNALQWVVLADDDTLLSVRRMQKLLGCYDSDIPYVLGERYGYGVFNDNGYNYVTGGGGAALSRSAIMKITNGLCECPSDTTPDDMFLLGICLQRLNITLVHIPLFHQGRPNDYTEEYLHIGKPISFHKHWMTDPMQIYKKWLKNDAPLVGDKRFHLEL